MQRILLITALFFSLFSCTDDRDFPERETPITNPDYELIHYWNFNDNSTLVVPTYTEGGASLEYFGSYYDDVNPGSDINARNGNEAGNAFRLRNPSGEFIINIPTSGYKDVILSYAATRTGSGSQTQTISYTIDGTNYIQDGLSQTDFTLIEDTYVLISVNFSHLDATDNNPNFKVKVTFDTASSQITNGNNRIDNLTLDGIPTGGSNPNPEPEPEPEPGDVEVFHYWNFNGLASGNNPEIIANTGNGSIQYLGSYYDRVNPGSDVNAQNGDEAGSALRLRNESGDLIISIPTTNHSNIILKYVATRTGSGSQTQTISYTLDGTNYINTGLSVTEFTLTEDIYNLNEIDFSSISGANNNANFKVKISFDTASSQIQNGNNRIDNLTVEGNTL